DGFIRFFRVPIIGASKRPSGGVGTLGGMREQLKVNHPPLLDEANARQLPDAADHGIQERAEDLRTSFVKLRPKPGFVPPVLRGDWRQLQIHRAIREIGSGDVVYPSVQDQCRPSTHNEFLTVSVILSLAVA